MNKLYIFFFCLIIFKLGAQTSYTGNLTITTQEQIDDFFDNNYSVIDGILRIEGDNISSLVGLINLEEVTSSLIIQDTPNLSSLEGLNNLEVIGPGYVGGNNSGGHLWIENTGLTSILDFNNLQTVWTDLRFIDNPYLENLEGLHDLLFVGRFLWIDNNSSLENIEGLRNIQSVGSDLRIMNNPNLNSLFGLREVDTVYDLISIYNNDSLENLTGLEGISTVPNSFFISENDLLNSLSSLSSLTDVDGNLSIVNNISLISLQGLQGLIETNYLIIEGNSSLVDYCSLTNLFSEGSVIYSTTIDGNYFNPTTENIANGDCALEINDISINLILPEINDLYVSGYPIGIVINSEQIPPFSILEFYYKNVEDDVWNQIESGNYAESYSSLVNGEYHYYFLAPEVSLLEHMQVKIVVELNSSIKEEESGIFQVQPVDYQSNLGFSESAISVFSSPFDYYTETLWHENFGSPGHFCADAKAQDWELNFPDTCFKSLYAPFDGTILKVRDVDYFELCGFSPDETGGKQVIIQSSENKNFAITFAHLSYIDVQEGHDIFEGELIGRIGGTGTNLAHAHVSLHKNIYSWFAFYNIEDESYSKYQMIDFLKNAETYYDTTNSEICSYSESNFSAEFYFDFSFQETVNTNDVLITNESEFSAFTQNDYEGSIATIQAEYESEGLNSSNNEATTNITSLSELSSLRSIDGDFILRNLEITDLTGLENLLYISGDLIIENNSNLNNYCGIYNLLRTQGLQGSLIVSGNYHDLTEENILNDHSCAETLSLGQVYPMSKIVAYPNPTVEDIFLNISDLSNLKIEIFSLKGELLGELRNLNRISLQNFTSGLYILKIIKDNEVNYFKILKN